MKWSFPKLLYIIARYSGLFYLQSVSFFRSPIQNRYATGSQVPTGSVDLIFILRVCALYGNSKRSTRSFSGYYLSNVSLTFSALVSIAFSKSAVAIPSIGQQTTAYCFTLALQTTLFLLTFFRVGRDFIRDSGGLKNAIMGNKAGVGSTLIFSVGSALQLNTFLNFITPCYIAITSMMGSRLILKLRQMYDTEINECTPAVFRSIFFAEPGESQENIVEEVVFDENEGIKVVLRRDS
ncbi:hypothetical protein BDQ17DRAFT_1373715, partial [Cyathus striatus]